MANELRTAGSLTIVNDNSVTNEGSADGDYTHLAVDAHAGRTFGGKYNIAAAYDSDAVARYTSSVVAEDNTTDGLDSSGWQKGAGGPTSGTLPVTVEAIAVEYVSTLGTVATVYVAIKSTGEIRLAELAVGEGIVVPIVGGLTLANVLIGASAYTSGTHEATVNVLVAGQNA